MKDLSNQINQGNRINHGSDNSYDIIKAFGGGMKVETKQWERAGFIVSYHY